MKKAAAHPTTKSPRDNNPFALGVVVSDLLDTTWRIAVPVVLGAVLGILADKQLGTKPWLTLLLTAVGFVGAALLIKRQLAAVAAGDDSPEASYDESLQDNNQHDNPTNPRKTDQ